MQGRLQSGVTQREREASPQLEPSLREAVSFPLSIRDS